MDFDPKKFSEEELCKIYFDPNSWKWNDKFGTKPDGFDEMDEEEQLRMVRSIMLKIESYVGNYKLLMYWNVECPLNLKRCSIEEFKEYALASSFNITHRHN